MYIVELRIQQFRNIRDAVFGPFRQPINHSELIILAGPNGGGKSSVLELLSQSLTTRYGWQLWMPRQIQNESFALKIGFDETEIYEIVALDLSERTRSGNLTEDAKAKAKDENLKVANYLNMHKGYWIERNFGVVDKGDAALNDHVISMSQRAYSNFTRKLGFSFVRNDPISLAPTTTDP